MKEPREIIRNPLRGADSLQEYEPLPAPVGQYPSYRNQRSEGFQFVDYWRAIRKRLWLVLGITVLMTTLAAVYMARRPDVYQAKAQVQVDLEQVNPDLVTSDRQRPLINSDPAYINTQLQLLGSDALIRRVIKEHNLDSNKEFQQTRTEESASAWRSMLRSLGLASDDSNRSRSPSPELEALQMSLGASEEVAEAVRLAPYVEAIQRNLDVEPVRETRAAFKETRLIEVTYRHTDPVLAAFVVNALGKAFTDQNQEKRTGTSRKTNDFLQERIAGLQADIRRDEEAFLRLKEQAGVINTQGEQTIVIDRLSGLNKDLLVAENDRKNAEANYLTVMNSPEKVRALAEAESARYITEQEASLRGLQTETLKKIADLRQTRALRLQEYLETAPEITEIEAQIKSYQSSLEEAFDRSRKDIETFRGRTTKTLLENLRTKYLQAKDKEDKIRVDFNKQFNEAQGQNQSAVRTRLLQQNIETNRTFLDNLQKQVSSNDVASQGSDNNIRVSEIAIPEKNPVSPRRLATVFAALVLSTVFGMGLALFLEYLDDTIRTTEEIESYLQLPALAAIPSIDSLPKRKLLLVGAAEAEDDPSPQSPLLISADSRSSLAEAYRHLRTSILLSTAGHAPKSLLISSSLPSEGKSTIASNTAISLAQTGAKVLIIDADMRRPRLHSIFNVKNGAGLSSVLASELTDAEVNAAINQDDRTKLFIMTSGPIPPNPAELIGSEQMVSLLRILSAKFTHIIIDSPPIASFTDGVLIASMVDGVILVVHAGKSSRQVVRRSRQMLHEIGAKIFGVVLNNVDLNNKDNYYYYQSYYHRGAYAERDED